MRVLVLGGSGFIGPHLVRLLVERGHRAAVFNRGQRPDTLPGSVERLRGDLERPAQAREAWARFAPEVAVYMVPLGEEDARRVADALAGVVGRVVGLSSGDVYRAFGRVNRFEGGPPEDGPLTEGSPLRQRLFPYRDQADGPADWRYSYDKILAERVLLGNPRLPGTVLRLPAVYGQGDPFRRLAPYLRRMDDGRPAILLQRDMAAWRWSRGHVENAAQAIALAVERPDAGGVFNVADPQALGEAEWVRRIGRLAGWRGEIVPVEATDLPAGMRQDGDFSQDVVMDSGRIRRELGYTEKLDIDAWIAKTVAWERQHPPAEGVVPPPDYAAEDACLAAATGKDAP